VITEASKITPLCGINEFALRERHEIKVLDTFIIILDHASTKGSLIDDFADIFEYEVARLECAIRSKAIAFLFGLNHCDVRVLLALKALVLAFASASTIADTLHFCCSIDTVGVFAACMICTCYGI
jgi:hypothetical protein